MSSPVLQRKSWAGAQRQMGVNASKTQQQPVPWTVVVVVDGAGCVEVVEVVVVVVVGSQMLGSS